MEKLIHISKFPKIKTITSACVLQREATVYFEDWETNKYEIHFPVAFDFRQSIEAAFLGRKFDLCSNRETHSSLFLVENSDWIEKFIKLSDGIYGDDSSSYMHFLLFDSVDTYIEIITTDNPSLAKI